LALSWKRFKIFWPFTRMFISWKSSFNTPHSENMYSVGPQYIYLFLPCNWSDFCKKCTQRKKNRKDQESNF
jgi:hypothetical protein